MSADRAGLTATLHDLAGGSHRAGDLEPDYLGAALEPLPIGIFVVSRDGVIVRANRASQQIFRQPETELVGLSLDMLLPNLVPSDGSQPDQNGPPRELLGRRKDGSEVPVHTGVVPIQVRESTLLIVWVLANGNGNGHERPQSADDRLEFVHTIGELGAEFVSLRPDEVDRMIEDALGRVVRALDLDRSALFQLEESGDFVHTHQWTRPGMAPPPLRISASEHFPWHLAQVRAGELVSVTNIDDVPNEVDRTSLRRIGTRSHVTIPLIVSGRVSGAVTFAAVSAPRVWTPGIIARLRVVAVMFANALARKLADERLRSLFDDMTALRDRLRDENRYLRDELQNLTGSPSFVGHSPAIRRVLEQIRHVAPTDSTVLLLGETGTGKALLAAQIHELSARSAHPMVRVNCASLTAALEGELLGSDGSSPPDLEPRHRGRFELANKSTVFLDEVADLPLEAQASLVRALQENEVRQAGAGGPVKLDVRVIAATRKDLKRCTEKGAFRDDLYYRLNVFPIHVPPLRERREDIPLLVWRFVDEFSQALGKPIDSIDQASMTALQAYRWPGNARELRNVVERAIIAPTGRRLHIPLPLGPRSWRSVAEGVRRRSPSRRSRA